VHEQDAARSQPMWCFSFQIATCHKRSHLDSSLLILQRTSWILPSVSSARGLCFPANTWVWAMARSASSTVCVPTCRHLARYCPVQINLPKASNKVICSAHGRSKMKGAELREVVGEEEEAKLAMLSS
jgi:hypothetical protein